MLCLQVYHGAWPVPYCWGGWLHIGRRLTIDVKNHWQFSSNEWDSNRKCTENMPFARCNWPFLWMQESMLWAQPQDMGGALKMSFKCGWQSYCTYCQISDLKNYEKWLQYFAVLDFILSDLWLIPGRKTLKIVFRLWLIFFVSIHL